MKRMIERARSDESGFTLIELMIVIVILGVLAGIVIFAVGGISDTGDVAACKTDVKTISVAVEAYKAKTGNYPLNLVPAVTVAPNVFLRWDPAFTGTTAADGPAPATSSVWAGKGYNVTYYPDNTVAPFVAGDVDADAIC